MESGLPVKVRHGGTIKRHLEKTGQNALDFSASLNPFPPVMDWEFPPSLLDHYPDDDYLQLKEVIGRLFHRDVEEIAVGNGSIELIRSFSQAMFRNNGAARIDAPTFGEYLMSVELAGGHLVKEGEIPRAAFLCNPNNPTGYLFSKNDVSMLLKSYADQGTCMFLDEAFIELANPRESLIATRDSNLCILRSLTKCFSVPGLRFGYAFGDPDLVCALEVLRPPWSVNAFAEHFALQAFSKYHELEESRRKISIERNFLVSALRDLGFTVMPPSANFILADTGGYQETGVFHSDQIAADVSRIGACQPGYLAYKITAAGIREQQAQQR
ncbi:MAG: aminotransferase class I/II-fold pyridoxal phosphate-dependent enzyme, partial [Methanoregulaceae archaeon]|nr:aminotransferase class I/II-fold pyridoxal phosphate-dependent enzyme [Methanoregulaceae archaeon]